MCRKTAPHLQASWTECKKQEQILVCPETQASPWKQLTAGGMLADWVRVWQQANLLSSLFTQHLKKKKENKNRKQYSHTCVHTHTPHIHSDKHSKYIHKINNPSYNVCKSTNDTGMHLRGIYTKYSSYAWKDLHSPHCKLPEEITHQIRKNFPENKTHLINTKTVRI